MIKVTVNEFYAGTKFDIRNSWRNKIANTLGIKEDKFPFDFQVTAVDCCTYTCKSIQNRKTDKEYTIIISSDILKYLFGEEVPDCNVGLYSTDYIPIENSKLLLTDCKNKLNVLPVQFVLDTNIVDSIENTVKIEFVYQSLIIDKKYSIKSHSKDTWKLLNSNDTYMSDVEKMFQDTMLHKEFVNTVGTKFISYLESKGLKEDANELRLRIKVHDNSKLLNKDEFRALTKIINDKQSLKSADKSLSIYKQDAIELHWKNNRHHPEHYENIEMMERVDIEEMCCDWMARSLQYNTNLLDFAEKRQADRFHFPEHMYNDIIEYCKVLVDLCK